MIKHLVINGDQITEMTYQIRGSDGIEYDSCARTFGHLSAIEMVIWIEQKRKSLSLG